MRGGEDGASPAAGSRRMGGRAVAVSLLALVVVGGAVFADAARWACSP